MGAVLPAVKLFWFFGGGQTSPSALILSESQGSLVGAAHKQG